ncbi:branched-chain amino acid transport system ATP-binding protein [Bradyrhizobium sp. i1.3.1]
MKSRPAYQGLVAISAVSIEVQKGEIVCVAGANGAGKSTLLKSIAGAERPRSGTVTFDGKRLDGMAQHHITATGIAYVPENRRLFPRLSVRDNLRLGSYLYRGDADREGPLNLVFTLFPRLQERLEQRAETLSGGEQQMLAIGRALMTRPRLLMLDEPSQGIMPKLVDEIFQAWYCASATPA